MLILRYLAFGKTRLPVVVGGTCRKALAFHGLDYGQPVEGQSFCQRAQGKYWRACCSTTRKTAAERQIAPPRRGCLSASAPLALVPGALAGADARRASHIHPTSLSTRDQGYRTAARMLPSERWWQGITTRWNHERMQRWRERIATSQRMHYPGAYQPAKGKHDDEYQTHERQTHVCHFCPLCHKEPLSLAISQAPNICCWVRLVFCKEVAGCCGHQKTSGGPRLFHAPPVWAYTVKGMGGRDEAGLYSFARSI